LDISKAFAKRSFLVIIGFMLMLMLGVDAGAYFGIERLLQLLASDSWNAVSLLKLVYVNFFNWFLPASAAVFVLCGFILWLILRGSVSSLLKKQAVEQPLNKKGKKDAADHRIEQERRRRVFLHVLSVLQREGRLLDFFDEDLSLYDDEQIGAAVRSIQEDCKKTVGKYLAPKPVIDKEEGDEVVVELGFDPDAIKLTGNVTGKPPFKGVLRHRGWKAGKREIPKLSDVLDSTIIVPAEVEME
jgi:FlaA1/EpsC-like NDP-sugar epimerase